MLTNTKRELLVKIASLYYKENKSQDEIASVVGLSRSQVSRLLSKAIEEGVVSIQIQDSEVEAYEIEKSMRELFGLTDCAIVDDAGSDLEEFYERVGQTSGEVLRRFIRDDDIVGVSSGKTLFHATDHIPNINRRGVTLVPVVGSIGPKNSRWQAMASVTNLSNKWNASSYLLSVPSAVSSKEIRDIILAEPEIRDVVKMAKKANVVLVGMGHVKDKTATLFETGFLTEENLLELEEKNAVVSCCGSIVNAEGKNVGFSGDDRTLAIKLDDFSDKTIIIAVAYGKEKIDAILGALATNRINVLITDKSTAKELVRRKKLQLQYAS